MANLNQPCNTDGNSIGLIVCFVLDFTHIIRQCGGNKVFLCLAVPCNQTLNFLGGELFKNSMRLIPGNEVGNANHAKNGLRFCCEARKSALTDEVNILLINALLYERVYIAGQHVPKLGKLLPMRLLQVLGLRFIVNATEVAETDHVFGLRVLENGVGGLIHAEITGDDNHTCPAFTATS